MDDHYEDVTVGATYDLGTYEVTATEIRDFAAQYDPQAVHTGEAESPLADGLVASGWHTAAMTMRLLVDGYLGASGALLATGVDRLRWPEPVRPGDTLRATLEIADKQPRDDLGEVEQRVETRTDAGVVLSMVGRVLFERRDEDSL